ncbi:MAG: sigma-70 family RNA polymerase sigma factor [Spirochaetales bacterium]|nr:sigma-70 family RNA polymerase sigma factor [Spirochaetales bacterium]
MKINVEELYKKYGPMVLRRCRQLMNNNEEAALDAMQETFVRLLKYKERLKAYAPSSLLYTMATNVCLNLIRSKKRYQDHCDDEVLLRIAVSDSTEERVWAEDMLDRIFSKEKASTRTIAVLYYIDKMTLEEVSAEVGLSISGVRKRLRSLKQKVSESEEVMI